MQAVLQVMLEDPERELYGFELAKSSGLASGTIYPILARLVSSGWVTSRWEEPEAGREEGRPPRRYFRLTAEGRSRALHALARTQNRRATTSGLLGRAVEGGAST